MARIEAFLDSLESPEVVLPQLVREMSKQLEFAVSAEARSLSAVKADQRRLDEANGKLTRLQQGARLAVNSDDIETARQAISAQINLEKKISDLQIKLENSETAFKSAKSVRIQFQNHLKNLRTRKRELLSRHRQAKMKRNILEKTENNKYSDNSIMDAVARIEAKVEMEESVVEVQNEINKTLGSAFNLEKNKGIQNSREVDRRLDILKKGIKG